MTSEQSMALSLASIFSSEDSPAGEQAPPAEERAWVIQRLRSGGRWPEPLAILDRGTSSSRTLPTFSQSAGNVDPTDAYVAGLIDGEGCLGISKKLTVTVDVGMTEPALPLLRDLAGRYGGKVRPFRKATDTWSAAYTWTITGAKATAMLELLLPRLRLKQEQAHLLIKCQELRREMPLNRFSRPGWTPRLLTRGQAIREQVMALNRKGPRTDAAPPADAVWRRPQTTLLEPSGELFKGTWPRSGMSLLGIAYPLPPLAPRTSVTGSSRSPLLPTPIKRDGSNRGTARGAGSVERGGQPSLAQALLPTPVSQDGKNATAPSQANRNTPPLTHALLPTPAKADGERASENYGRGNPTLVGSLLPMSTATPYGNNQSPSEGAAVRPSLESLMRELHPADADGTGSTTEDSAPAATPTSTTPEGSTPNRETGPTASPTVPLLPTFTGASYQQGGTAAESTAYKRILGEIPPTGASTPERSPDGKKSPAPLLNPCFVAWMQGMPDGWSDPNCRLTAMEFTLDPRCSWARDFANSSKKTSRSD